MLLLLLPPLGEQQQQQQQQQRAGVRGRNREKARRPGPSRPEHGVSAGPGRHGRGRDLVLAVSVRAGSVLVPEMEPPCRRGCDRCRACPGRRSPGSLVAPHHAATRRFLRGAGPTCRCRSNASIPRRRRRLHHEADCAPARTAGVTPPRASPPPAPPTVSRRSSAWTRLHRRERPALLPDWFEVRAVRGR